MALDLHFRGVDGRTKKELFEEYLSGADYSAGRMAREAGRRTRERLGKDMIWRTFGG
jgi:hypothetical protein